MYGNEELILLGRIAGTHGLRGQVRVLPYSGESDGIRAVQSLYVKKEKGAWDAYPVVGVAGQGKKLLVQLEPFNTIDQVLPLVGCDVYGRRDEMPQLEDGEYYWQDLMGLLVVTDGGESLGTLADIFSTGSNDVYVVQGGSKEYLIPAIADVVVKVDLVGRIMTICPLEGLLDL
jgi:16S rRNA processing protein RimM